MRVLITTDTVGGVWTFTRELIAGLLAEGAEVCCVSYGGQPSASQCAEVAESQTLAGRRLQFCAAAAPLEWMENNGDAYSAGAGLLQQLAASWAPDVLHLNQFCFGALRCNLPKLITIHSDVFSWAAACGESGSLPHAWLGRYSELVRRGIAGAALLTAPTRWMLDAFLAGFPCGCPARVVANGVTLDPPADAPPRALQVVTAGRFRDQGKGLQLLEQLRSAWPMIVAGEHPAAGDTRRGFTLTGVLPAAALHRLFRQSAVYLCSSLYEPFGLAPLEAALCGCALVVRDLPSLREVWQDAAFYVQDAHAVEAVLDGFTRQPELLQAAQQRAAERAGTYTRARMTREYLAAYSHARELHYA